MVLQPGLFYMIDDLGLIAKLSKVSADYSLFQWKAKG